MDAVTLITRQLEAESQVGRGLTAEITDELWQRAEYPGANPLGFVAWHMIATRDWTLHSAIQGVPDVRERAPFVSTAVNPAQPPFGMSAADAVAIAAAVTRDGVLAYADAAHGAMMQWLGTLTPESFDRVPDLRANASRLPAYQVPGYIAEVEDMVGYPVWALLSAPCFAHQREHVGEIVTRRAALSAI
jgi:DinB family protein